MFPIRDNLPHRGVALVTWLVVLANVAVFWVEFRMGPERLSAAIQEYGVVPARVLEREGGALALRPRAWLPFLTSLFLHGGLLHLVGNMWTLAIFGGGVERRMGAVRFLLFYLLCGLLAGFVHTLTNAASSVPTIGASGAIAGVLGSYLVLFPAARIIVLVPILFYPLFVELPAFFYLAWWFLMQVFRGRAALASPELTGGVAWWAHVGGFLGGALLFPFFLKRGRRGTRGR